VLVVVIVWNVLTTVELSVGAGAGDCTKPTKSVTTMMMRTMTLY
jgi:hypothetical protein